MLQGPSFMDSPYNFYSFIYSFIHPFGKYLLRTAYLPDSVLLTRDTKKTGCFSISMVSNRRQMYKNNDNQYIRTVTEMLWEQSGGQ